MQARLPQSDIALLVAAATFTSPKDRSCDIIVSIRDSANPGPTLLSAGAEGSISRFSAGRDDPFVKYPIDLKSRTRALVDHSELPSRPDLADS